MGVVYEAVEEALGRTVALKLVAPERAGEPGFRERFIAESRLAASIDHPNVLPVFGAGEERRARCGSSMRFVDGADLRTLVAAGARRARRRSSRRSARRWTPRTRAGSCTATSSPPTSWSRAADHAYLTDFGLVKALDAAAGPHPHRRGRRDARLRRAGAHPRRAATGRAADLYSLGCVLFFALTGRVVFEVEGAERKLWAHLSEPPPAVPGHPAFDAVLARALAKDPAERYESGARARGGRRSRPPAARGRPALDSRPRAAASAGSAPPRPVRGGRAAPPRCSRRSSAPAERARLMRRGAGRHAAGARRAPARGGPRGQRPGQGAARRRARPAARRAAPDARARSTAATRRSSGSWSNSRPSAGACWPTTRAAGERLGALQDESRRSPSGSPPLVGNPPPRVAVRAGPRGPTIRAMSTIPTGCAARGGAATSRRTSSRRPCATSCVEELGGARAAPTSRSTACAPGTSPACTPTASCSACPPSAVDVAWHEMILQTREYTAFCERAFGGYLHHSPDSTLGVPMDAILPQTLAIVDEHELPMVAVHRRRRRGPATTATRGRRVRPAPHARLDDRRAARRRAAAARRRGRRRLAATPAAWAAAGRFGCGGRRGGGGGCDGGAEAGAAAVAAEAAAGGSA